LSWEADDALASAAQLAAADPHVFESVYLDAGQDLAQCVRDDRVVQIDRRANVIRDAKSGTQELRRRSGSCSGLFLHFVGDSADGFIGVSQALGRRAQPIIEPVWTH